MTDLVIFAVIAAVVGLVGIRIGLAAAPAILRWDDRRAAGDGAGTRESVDARAAADEAPAPGAGPGYDRPDDALAPNGGDGGD